VDIDAKNKTNFEKILLSIKVCDAIKGYIFIYMYIYVYIYLKIKKYKSDYKYFAI